MPPQKQEYRQENGENYKSANEIEKAPKHDDKQTEGAKKPPMEYTTANCRYNSECAICLEDPRMNKFSIAILPCSHMLCGLCLWHSVNHCLEVTGELDCPLCSEPYNA
jgi:hypothetical protein